MLKTAEALDASWLDAAPAIGTATQPDCLHALFERQVDLRGHATALVCAGRSLSYLELDRRANRLARSFRRLGVGPGVLVGLCLDRSELPIVAILGCLKAGGAYVPLEPGLPDERLRHILDEAEIGAVLTEARLEGRISNLFAGPTLVLDAQRRKIEAESVERLSLRETGLAPGDICYVLYTSGTTGRPKGVAAEHRNVTHFVRAFNEVCATTPADRVFQGFSLGFDGSVEEIWMAFSNGAALAVGTPETPKFGNDLARYLSAAGVTYFSTVPTMLSTMTEDVPSLRQLVVSGEACPPELVARWARPGRRMLNVYGPTEATVNTTAALCEPGRPITIGRPLDGYDVLILDADMQPVEPGATGELYIGGAGLARGYLNQPELTARAFVRRGTGRLYRTGDLARINAHGEIEFFGRIDAQVKIRGFRVELAEIEAVLQEQDEIATAVVGLHDRDGVPVLAAYVVLDEGAAAIDRGQVLAALRARLPSYMVPAYLDVLDDLPRLASGKVDRPRLPQPVSPLVGGSGKGQERATPLEARIAATWAEIFSVERVDPTQDFFLDLGGHSLFAAQAVAALRERAGIHIPVRDLYAHPTVRKLAQHVEAKQPAAKAESEDASAPHPSATPRKPGLLLLTAQFGSMLLGLALFSLPLVVVIPIVADFLGGRISLVRAFVYLAGLALVLWPVAVAIGLGAKWLIIGRYRRGAYPLWGSYYFRWWLVSRLQALSGAGAFIGTPLMPVYYRLMGAKVGRRCALDTALCSAWDTVSIGDDTSIGADTQLLGCRVENGQLLIGRVEIGSRCFVGLHSAFGLDVAMGDDARLDDQSLLPDGEHIPAGEARRGSPARPAEVDVPAGPVVRHSRAWRLAFTMVQLVSAAAFGFLMALPGLSLLLAAAWLVTNVSLAAAVVLLAATPVMVVVYCLWIAAMKALVLPRPVSGTYALHSFADLRYWLAGGLMRATRGMFLPIFTTLYLPPWMRLLGARIGRHSEMSTVFCYVPGLLTAGDGSFFADGSILGGRRTHCGRFEIGPTQVGNRSFVGNGAILPPGAGLGDSGLLGVLSAPPERARPTPDGTDWLGSPAFLLPNRHKVAGFDDEVTYAPTRELYAQRAVIDTCRILIPAYTATFLGLGALLALLLANAFLGPWLMLALVLPLAIATVTIAVLVVVGLKWAVMGTFRPVIVPLWCPYVWLNEMVNGAYESIMAPVVAAFFGTPLSAVLLRLLGCRIGRHCYIGSSLFSEFDLVRIGDHVALNGGAVVQNHLFEDRIMKSSYVDIGNGCSVGNMAVVLYDTRMGERAVLGPLSLLMKGEIMPDGSRWHGIPTVQG